MDEIEQMLNVPTISDKTNFWMIRTKRGFFFDEFIEEKYIAIGWNLVRKAMIRDEISPAQSKELKTSLKNIYDERKPGTALNKCIRFCCELKLGDIAVIVDNDRIAFATIGEYYEEKSSDLTIEHEKEVSQEIEKANKYVDSFKCPYIKRRKISVIKVLGENDTVSPYLQSAIAKNWHSLSDLNDYDELMLSCCYDTFIYKEKLTVTFRVNQKQDINVLDLTDFVLCAARLLSNNHPETVHVKTALHSPGDVILQIWNTLQASALPLLICYMAVFGGKVGKCEFNSLFSTIKDLINSKYEKDKKKIELRKLSAEADLAEQEALEKKLQNIEKSRALNISTAESCLEPLVSAAENLEIKPDDSTIINIQSILESAEIKQKHNE